MGHTTAWLEGGKGHARERVKEMSPHGAAGRLPVKEMRVDGRRRMRKENNRRESKKIT
jgi:hypothetical protein